MRRLPLRTNLALIIVCVGMLGMALTLLSGELYRTLALDHQHSSTTEQLRLETARMRDEFVLRTRALAMHAHGHAPFLKALASGQPPALVRELDEVFRQGSTAATGGVRLSRLYLLDANLKLKSASSAGDPSIATLPCAELVPSAVSAAERSRSANRLCLEGGNAYLIAVAALPAGGGYFYVVGDLAAGLNDIEPVLAAPLRLRRGDGQVVYRSAEWPNDSELASRLVATQTLFASYPKQAALELALAKDMSAFYERLMGLRYMILLSVVVLTAIAVLLALLAFERSALKPLRALATHLGRLRHDKSALAEPCPVRGNAEVAALASGFNDVATRLRDAYDQLERMACTDALTDPPNRGLLIARLEQAVASAKREVKPFALLMMDLDRFKDINDTLGHQAGDALLMQVAQRLRGKLRGSDTVARMGGDEFAVVLPAADEKHAGMAARMLLQALRAPFRVEDHDLSIGASIGIALYPENGVDASVLLQRADVAMYAAKASGSGFTVYSPAIDQNLPTRLTLLSDLRQAVEQEQFELYYQPIVNLVTNKVAGIEALARWRHPRDGILLPDSFIPLLEQSGMIHGLMPWVVSEALKHAHMLELAGMPLTISVNLSMRDLQDPYIVDSISELLQAHGVDPGTLVLEITESAVMTDAPRTLELLNRLAGMGLRIAIDDFGTGYSSLTYLKKLPVTTLKIDKSFVIGMIGDDNDAAIVRTSIDLAHNLGLKVVAEGVETEMALKRLKDLGCDLAQGHFIGRPLTHAELGEWLLQSSWGPSDADPVILGLRRLRT